MSLINELVKQSSRSKVPEPLVDEHGWKYYPEVPEGFRQATIADVRNGLFRKGTPFLLHGIVSSRYECHRISGEFPEKLRQFIMDGRVWICE